MGSALSTMRFNPKTEKTTSSAFSEEGGWLVATSTVMGWRWHQEDRVIATTTDAGHLVCAVFDGHGGSDVSEYLASNFVDEVIAEASVLPSDRVPGAIKLAAIELDTEMERQRVSGGSTANAIVVREEDVILVNVGDSRAIASVNGVLKVLSTDHKTSVASEERRILAAGAFIEDERVNGILAMARAFGDFYLKFPATRSMASTAVTAVPEVRLFDRAGVDWVLQSTDGVFDVMSNEDVFAFVRDGLSRGDGAEEIAENLLDVCLKPEDEPGWRGTDNMTVAITIL